MASTNVYDFRSGRSIKNTNPQEIGEELERLRKDHQKITPEIVLEAAKEEHSPLHNGFEWDDSAAAHQHRLAQARKLIVSVRILNSPMPTGPAFISIRSPEIGRNYVPAVEALSDEQLKARALEEIRMFIEAMERKYAKFEAVAEELARLKKNVG